MYCIAYIQ